MNSRNDNDNEVPPEKDPVKQEECRQGNLRTEYAALASYHGTVVTFRFTVVGLFLAAAGLLISTDKIECEVKALALIGLTLPVWIIEVRNRTLLRQLTTRGMQIEMLWGYWGGRPFEPFFQRMISDKGRMRKIDPKFDKGFRDIKPPPPEPLDWFCWRGIPYSSRTFMRVLSHTFAIDLLFLLTLLYALCALVCELVCEVRLWRN